MALSRSPEDSRLKLPFDSQGQLADNPDYLEMFFDSKALDPNSWPYLALCKDELDSSYTWHLFCDEQNIPILVENERKKEDLEDYISLERSGNRRRKLKIVELLVKKNGEVIHEFIDPERNTSRLYLPDDTITNAERMTLEFLRQQMRIENPEFPLQACADTAYLIEQVLGWPLVAVNCKLQQKKSDGRFYPHAVNRIPGTEILVDTTLEQFDPAKFEPAEGMVLTKQPDLVQFYERRIPEIAILPFDTPIFDLDNVGTDLLRSSPPGISIRNILDKFGMRARILLYLDQE